MNTVKRVGACRIVVVAMIVMVVLLFATGNDDGAETADYAYGDNRDCFSLRCTQ